MLLRFRFGLGWQAFLRKTADYRIYNEPTQVIGERSLRRLEKGTVKYSLHPFSCPIKPIRRHLQHHARGDNLRRYGPERVHKWHIRIHFRRVLRRRTRHNTCPESHHLGHNLSPQVVVCRLAGLATRPSGLFYQPIHDLQGLGSDLGGLQTPGRVFVRSKGKQRG